MSPHDMLIAELANQAGIAASYRDAAGTIVETSLASRRAVLEGMGLDTATSAATQEALQRLATTRQGALPRLIVATEGQPVRLSLRPGEGAEARDYVLTGEDGRVLEGRTAPGEAFALPALARGYWQLRLGRGTDATESLIISAPRTCYEPAGLSGGGTRWGATAQVYSLRSPTNFGIGEYGDVAELAEGAGALGADFLGLSPVHALFSADLTKVSPYSPSSRLFLDTQLISPQRIAGFGRSAICGDLQSPEWQERLGGLREAVLLDRAAAWSAKRAVLEGLWHEARTTDEPAFAAFHRQGGQALEQHALFEALSEHFAAEGALWVGDWPEAYRMPGSSEVSRFAQEHRERIDFHAWLQWQADLQLAQAQDAARRGGMEIGLFRDLAVGIDPAGSELWSARECFAPGLSIGAPPDLLGPEGQNWGLPPFNPLTMEKDQLRAFRATVAANMRHAGAIRIDHAFQLQRLYLIPAGAAAADGAYVAMPFEALLAVLRVESHRARCMVIAEDLGTAPEGFSDAIMAAGLYSYRVLPFEREADGRFKAPDAYPRRALAVLTTHDLPTFRGWWRGLDIDMRHASGRVSSAEAEQAHAERVQDREKLTLALAGQGLLPSEDPPADAPVEAATAYLGRARSALTAVQLEDAAGELNQANLPGPGNAHPNWQRRLSHDIADLTGPGHSLARLGAVLANEGRSGRQHGATALAAPVPRATYRLQFHEGFTFEDAIAIVPYLARLGISHVYASPIQTARPGSTHGYDIVDHRTINPELGGHDGFIRLSDTLKAHGLGLVLDIVPNHMGIGGADNAWWLSVIEWGRLSPHATAFDIDWERLGAHGKLVLPFLGKRYGDALEEGELKLTFEPEEGGFSIWHWEHRFPISPLTYPIVLDRILMLAESTEPAFRDVLAISARLRILSEAPGAQPAGLVGDCEALKRRLAQAFESSEKIRKATERAVALINGAAGVPDSFDTLHRILEMQSYRLAYWRVAASDINYRRFFDINTLAGIRVEEPEVFERTHALILELVREGRIQGLRIDHIDGLADPDAYVRALQAQAGPGFYILAEKILGRGETLRTWPMSGTTGYDVLNVIDGVLVDASSRQRIEGDYRKLTGEQASYEAMLHQAKGEVLDGSFASELEVVVSDLARIAAADRRSRDYTVHAMRRALTEIITHFPVYRTYIVDQPAPEDRSLIEKTVAAAVASSRLPDHTVHAFIQSALLGEIAGAGDGEAAELLARFRRRFQQLTGPVTAKSVEDTLFYRYGAMLALNEVGGEPNDFGFTPEEFHAANAERARSWPHAMIATATHDTKRGEDGRARLLVLSEMPERWQEAASDWQGIARELAASDAMPDANDRHIILQQMLASWPLALLEQDDPQELEGFCERMQQWVEKALREAKRRTSWVNPNEDYEAAAKTLIADALKPGSRFLQHFRPLAAELAQRGMLKSLARTVLKLTLPGVPDFYQGTEFWDFSLVDPDNRRPVDYARAERVLDQGASLDELLASWPDGRLKQQIVHRLLEERATVPRLYADGDYRPVAVAGEGSEALVAFERVSGEDALLVVVRRSTQAGALPEGATIPARNGQWQDLLTGRDVTVEGGRVAVGDLLKTLPVAVLRLGAGA